jgi:hypothetical protein
MDLLVAGGHSVLSAQRTDGSPSVPESLPQWMSPDSCPSKPRRREFCRAASYVGAGFGEGGGDVPADMTSLGLNTA